MYIIITVQYYVRIMMYVYYIKPVYRFSVSPSGLLVVMRYLGYAHRLVQIRRGLGIDLRHLSWLGRHMCSRRLLLSLHDLR
jgi:hypothetical protein